MTQVELQDSLRPHDILDVSAVSFLNVIHHLILPLKATHLRRSRGGNPLIFTPTHCSILQGPCYCMPPKQPLRDRAWGTRYDSLGPSPPISPHKQAFPSPATTPGSRPSSVDSNVHNAPDRGLTTPQTTHRPPLHDKMPHDASVFVGRYEQRREAFSSLTIPSRPAACHLPWRFQS